MAKVKIDDKEYDFNNLSDAAKLHLKSLQFVDSELARLQAQAAVFQTARVAYSKALNESLASLQVPTLAGSGDTLKLN